MDNPNINTFAKLMEIYNPKKNNFTGKICVFDVEATAIAPQKAFQFAYGFLAADTEKKSFNIKYMKSYLVYEAILDNKMMMEIANWKKIKMASDKSSLSFYKQLQDENWFSNNMSQEEIEFYANNSYVMDYESQINRQIKMISDIGNKVIYWQTKDVNNKSRSKYLPQRVSDLKKGYYNLTLLKSRAAMEIELKKSIITGENSTKLADRISAKVAQDMYNASKNTKILNESNYVKTLPEIRNLLGNKFKIETWNTIINKFQTEIKKYAVLVMSYSINNDKRFITNSCKAWGSKDIDWNNINNLCLMYTFNEFMKSIGNEELQKKIINYITKAKEQGLKSVEKFKMSRISGDKITGQALSLAIIYPAIINISDYKQEHSAVQDTREAMEVLIEMLKPSLDEYIKNSLKNKQEGGK